MSFDQDFKNFDVLVDKQGIFHNLYGEYQQAQERIEKIYVLGKIFFSTTDWLNKNKANRTLTPQHTATLGNKRVRHGALFIKPEDPQVFYLRAEALQKSVATELCIIFGNITINVLPRYLEERFRSIGLTKHGIQTDKDTPGLKRIDASDRSKYQVSFNGSQAVIFEFWKKTDAKWVPIDTTSWKTKEGGGNDSRSQKDKHRFWCWGYVFTKNEEIYVANHAFQETDGKRFFHSSYLSGENVLCAGDISFFKGQLTSISNFSGHYQPSMEKIYHVLKFFKKNMHSLKDVKVLAAEIHGTDLGNKARGGTSVMDAKDITQFGMDAEEFIKMGVNSNFESSIKFSSFREEIPGKRAEIERKEAQKLTQKKGTWF